MNKIIASISNVKLHVFFKIVRYRIGLKILLYLWNKLHYRAKYEIIKSSFSKKKKRNMELGDNIFYFISYFT